MAFEQDERFGSTSLSSEFDRDVYSSKYLTRNHIIQVAESLFMERGYNSVSVKDICSAAGVSRQTFYRHFDNKASMGSWLVANIVQRNFSFIGKTRTWEEALAAVWDDCNRNLSYTMGDPARQESLDMMTSISRKNIRSILVGEFRNRGIKLTKVLDFEIDLFALVMSATFLEFVREDKWQELSSSDRGILLAKVVPEELKQVLLEA